MTWPLPGRSGSRRRCCCDDCCFWWSVTSSVLFPGMDIIRFSVPMEETISYQISIRETWGSHSGIAEDPSLCGCHAVDGGEVPDIPKDPSALIKLSRITILLWQLNTQDKCTTILQNIRNYSRNNTPSQSRRHPSSNKYIQYCNKPHQYTLCISFTVSHNYIHFTCHSYHTNYIFFESRHQLKNLKARIFLCVDLCSNDWLTD